MTESLMLWISTIPTVALYLHRGSAESRDGDDRIESKIDDVKEMLERRSS